MHVIELLFLYTFFFGEEKKLSIGVDYDGPKIVQFRDNYHFVPNPLTGGGPTSF